MQYVVQMEEVDISDGCEAVNVWDLDCSESLARARKLAKGIIRSIKEHALPQLSEISDKPSFCQYRTIPVLQKLWKDKTWTDPGCFGCRNDSVRDLERRVIMKDCFVLFRYYLEE